MPYVISTRFFSPSLSFCLAANSSTVFKLIKMSSTLKLKHSVCSNIRLFTFTSLFNGHCRFVHKCVFCGWLMSLWRLTFLCTVYGVQCIVCRLCITEYIIQHLYFEAYFERLTLHLAPLNVAGCFRDFSSFFRFQQGFLLRLKITGVKFRE